MIYTKTTLDEAILDLEHIKELEKSCTNQENCTYLNEAMTLINEFIEEKQIELKKNQDEAQNSLDTIDEILNQNRLCQVKCVSFK